MIDELLAYARTLQRRLDDFAMNAAYHRVTIVYSDSAVMCNVKIVKCKHEAGLGDIEAGMIRAPKFDVFRFEDSKVTFAKPARSYLWTARQAQQDAADLIGTVLSGGNDNE